MQKSMRKFMLLIAAMVVAMACTAVAAFAVTDSTPLTIDKGTVMVSFAEEGNYISGDTVTLTFGSTNYEKFYIGEHLQDFDANREISPARTITSMVISKRGSSEKTCNQYEIPKSAFQNGTPVLMAYQTTTEHAWYTKWFTLNEEAGTLTVRDYVPSSMYDTMEIEAAKKDIDEHNSIEVVETLIDKIYVQVRDENTDKMCELAKYAWDHLSADEQKAMSESDYDHNDYFSAETGDASKDDPRNDAPTKDKEILVLSFGTSFNDSRVEDIKAVEDKLAAAYPSYDVRRAFTAQIIINHVQSRENEFIDNVDQAMEKAVKAGVKELVVQPTHLMHGAEYDELVGQVNAYKDQIEKITFAEPLLGPVGSDESVINQDKERVAKAIVSETVKDGNFESRQAAEDNNIAFVFMGHGTAHEAKITYAQMQTQMNKLGYNNVFIGTVEGEPESTSLTNVIDAVKKAGYDKVVLRPLMVVAGDHANNDMAGDDDDSWKMGFLNAGFDVKTQINGLGEIEAVQNLYAKHTAEAMGDTAAADKFEAKLVKAELTFAQEELAGVKASQEASKQELAKAQKELQAAKNEIAAMKTQNAAVSSVKIKAIAKGHKVTLSWKKTSAFDGYQVSMKKGSGKWTVVAKATKGSSVTKSKLAKKKSYSFKVRGYKKIAGKTVYGKYVTKTVKAK